MRNNKLKSLCLGMALLSAGAIYAGYKYNSSNQQPAHLKTQLKNKNIEPLFAGVDTVTKSLMEETGPSDPKLTLIKYFYACINGQIKYLNDEIAFNISSYLSFSLRYRRDNSLNQSFLSEADVIKAFTLETRKKGIKILEYIKTILSEDAIIEDMDKALALVKQGKPVFINECECFVKSNIFTKIKLTTEEDIEAVKNIFVKFARILKKIDIDMFNSVLDVNLASKYVSCEACQNHELLQSAVNDIMTDVYSDFNKLCEQEVPIFDLSGSSPSFIPIVKNEPEGELLECEPLKLVFEKINKYNKKATEHGQRDVEIYPNLVEICNFINKFNRTLPKNPDYEESNRLLRFYEEQQGDDLQKIAASYLVEKFSSFIGHSRYWDIQKFKQNVIEMFTSKESTADCMRNQLESSFKNFIETMRQHPSLSAPSTITLKDHLEELYARVQTHTAYKYFKKDPAFVENVKSKVTEAIKIYEKCQTELLTILDQLYKDGHFKLNIQNAVERRQYENLLNLIIFYISDKPLYKIDEQLVTATHHLSNAQKDIHSNQYSVFIEDQ